MEIKTPFSHLADGTEVLGRHFVWLDRGERMAANAELPIKDFVGKVKEYTGRASRMLKDEKEGPLDNPKSTMHIYEYKKKVSGVELTYFYWMLKYDKIRVGDETDTLEKAAEACYRAFYKNTSKIKFDCALLPENHKWVVVLGNWVTSDDLKQAKNKAALLMIPEATTDERDGQMFVMNFPNPAKEKVRLLPKEIKAVRNVARGSVNQMDYVVVLGQGTKIEASMDWYLLKPEDKVEGEVYCPRCDMAGSVGSLGILCVRGHGPRCGPCINWMLEFENLDDSCFDIT